ncbi:MAG: N-acetylglucosamine-6-phosphate deacetylase [Bacillales bacterium]|jgi:N-acetylglucosamine-6-phosphate deacetylase|nr:N-acetylglucosamine-6-phosphate deacetylase [Bacillales bacterium]
MKGFKNSNIYVSGKGIIKTSLFFDEGIIKKIGNDLKEKDLIEIPDEYIVVPGFIDEHIHGANGFDVSHADLKGLDVISKALLQEGVTYFLPTTMSTSYSNILLSLKNIAKYQKEQKQGAEVLGIHLEGPFINEELNGAQNQENIIPCDVEILKDFIEASNNNIKIITFAYEKDGYKIMPLLKQHNIVGSIGHSKANSKEANEAFLNGVTSSTHTYNCQSGLHHRDVGVVGSVLLNDNVYAELIADLKHVSAPAIQILFKMKGPEKIVLISDATEAKYLKDGEYMLGDQKVYLKDGYVKTETGALAGSVLKLNEALKNIHLVVPSLSFTQLIDLVTINPANNLRLTNVGSIKVGNKAKFVVIDKDFNVVQTII